VNASWPSKGIRSLQSCLELVYHPCIAPFICFAHNIAIPLHDEMRNIRPPPGPPCIFHTPYNIGNGNIVERLSCGPAATTRWPKRWARVRVKQTKLGRRGDSSALRSAFVV